MKRTMKALLATTLAVCMLLCCLGGCASTGKTMMELKSDGITVKMSVNVFQLYLSRMKGMLASSEGAQVLSDSYWDVKVDSALTTRNEKYTNQILEEAKTYLAALYLFEKNGLKLPKETEDAIDAEIKEMIQNDANGSKAEFDSMLAEYGANRKVLKESMMIEAKIALLKDSLFGANGSLIDDDSAEGPVNQYYQQNYRRFKQVFLYTYDYAYETEEGTDTVIYYTDTTYTHRAYDISATPKLDANGALVKDANGDAIYVRDGKTAYNTQTGVRKHLMDDNGNKLMMQFKTDAPEQYEQVRFEMEQIEEKVVQNDLEVFDALVEQYSLDEGMDNYPGGYYVTRETNFDSPDVIKKVFALEVGQTAMVESDYGFHLIMRYDLEDKGYQMKENSDFFIGQKTGAYVFADALENQLLAGYLESYKAQIIVDEALLAEVDIKKIGANLYY